MLPRRRNFGFASANSRPSREIIFCFANCFASRIAAIMLPGFAMPFPGDVVSRAVIGRGADERQAERPVHAAVEGDGFQRRQPLIVIHRHDGVKIPLQRVVKNRVAAQRARRHRIPVFRAARTVGPIVVISSSPNSPPSPACGFRPQTATCARGKPRSRQDCAASSMASVIFSAVNFSGTDLMEM